MTASQAASPTAPSPLHVAVTGAAGFVGQATVAALAGRGHTVTAIVRRAAAGRWPAGTTVVEADLGRPDGLGRELAGTDVVVHLAAAMTGSDEALFRGTVVTTERLVGALSAVAPRRFVLVGSAAVYDWTKARGALDECCPLEGDRLYDRDGYAVAKLWQERIVTDAASHFGWELTILRPGFVWGPGREWLYGIGLLAGDRPVVFGAATPLPLTYVANCADAIAAAVGAPSAGTWNVVDDYELTSRAYVARLRAAGLPWKRPVVVPYRAGWLLSSAATAAVRSMGAPVSQLPALLGSRKYQARFRPLRFPNERIRAELGWSPPLDLDACLADLRSRRAAAALGGAQPAEAGNGQADGVPSVAFG